MIKRVSVHLGLHKAVGVRSEGVGQTYFTPNVPM